MAELDSKIETVDALDDGMIGEMFALYRRYYGGTGEKLFRSDLAEKQRVIVLRDRQDRLQGFSTVAVTGHRFEGKPVSSIFTGDTVVDDRYWGQQSLIAAFLRLSGSVKAEAPEVPLYWFFVVMSQRTYRYLRAFFKVFFPAYDRDTPPREKALMDLFARQRFGECYDAESGIISFASPMGYLNPSWAEIPKKVQNRPDVKFFLERNPGYMNGDELVCLTELAVDNLKPPARPPFLEGMEKGI